MLRMPQRVREGRDAVRAADACAHRERTHLELVELDHAAEGRVRGIEHLESAVEEESVDHVGTLSPADPVGRLEDDHLAPGASELERAAESGEPRPDDHHVVCAHDASIGALAHSSIESCAL